MAGQCSSLTASAYRSLLHLCGLSAGIAIAGLAVFITLDVILRNLGITNFPWLLEVSEYVIFIATFMAAPWVLHLGSHVRVDLVTTALPRRMARIVDIVANMLGLAMAATLTWYGLRVTLDTLSRGDLLYKELVIPEWPLLAVIPASGILLAIEFARRIWVMTRDPEPTGKAPLMTDGI